MLVEAVTVEVNAVEAHRRTLLQDVSLAWQPGERIGLLGKNGSGKTTLARLLAGLENASQGKVHGRQRVLLILQRPEDQFIQPTVLRQIRSYFRRQVPDDLIRNLCVEVGLPEELASRSPQSLSTGRQRLVAIACALAADPSFLILDEPMAGLDAHNRAAIRKALLQLENCGLMIISHHPDDLMGLVQRLVIIDSGQLSYDGPFHGAPVTVLAGLLPADSLSFYGLMRRLEESYGLAVHKRFYYQQPDTEGLATFMNAAR